MNTKDEIVETVIIGSGAITIVLGIAFMLTGAMLPTLCFVCSCITTFSLKYKIRNKDHKRGMYNQSLCSLGIVIFAISAIVNLIAMIAKFMQFITKNNPDINNPSLPATDATINNAYPMASLIESNPAVFAVVYTIIWAFVAAVLIWFAVKTVKIFKKNKK